MPIFALPEGLVEVGHFTMGAARTWGSKDDAAYRDRVLQCSGLSEAIAEGFEWFAFCIRTVVGRGRGSRQDQVPDVENMPKLIVDAFTGHLYPDDNLFYVRGVQVEAEWGEDRAERTEVWIYGQRSGSPGLGPGTNPGGAWRGCGAALLQRRGAASG